MPLITRQMLRTRRLSIFVLLALAGLGIWMLFGSPVTSRALTLFNPLPSNLVSPKLETLHQRVVARTQAASAVDAQSPPAWGHAVTPEQAALLGQQAARARGDATTQLVSIGLQTRSGVAVYAVQMALSTVYINADTGAVVP
jgi:hypothetical protein